MKANIKELAAKAGLAKVLVHPTSDSGVFISLDAEIETKLIEFAENYNFKHRKISNNKLLSFQLFHFIIVFLLPHFFLNLIQNIMKILLTI
jgi:hypothetical protein